MACLCTQCLAGLTKECTWKKKPHAFTFVFYHYNAWEYLQAKCKPPLLYGYDLQQALCLRTVILPKITAQNHMRPVRAKVHCRRLQDLCVAASVFIATQPLRLRGFRFAQPLWKRCGGRLLRTLTFYKLAGTADAAYFFYCDCFFCTMALYRFFVQPLNSFHSSDKWFLVHGSSILDYSRAFMHGVKKTCGQPWHAAKVLMLKYVPQHTVFYHKRYHKNKKSWQNQYSPTQKAGMIFLKFAPWEVTKGLCQVCCSKVLQ